MTEPEPCAASVRIGCPDSGTVLVCHRPVHEPDRDHYDGQERLWWNGTQPEPPLYTECGRCGRPIAQSECSGLWWATDDLAIHEAPECAHTPDTATGTKRKEG